MSSDNDEPLTANEVGEWLIQQLAHRGCSVEDIAALNSPTLDQMAKCAKGGAHGSYTDKELERIGRHFDVHGDFKQYPKYLASCRAVIAQALSTMPPRAHERLKRELKQGDSALKSSTVVPRVFDAARMLVPTDLSR